MVNLIACLERPALLHGVFKIEIAMGARLLHRLDDAFAFRLAFIKECLIVGAKRIERGKLRFVICFPCVFSLKKS